MIKIVLVLGASLLFVFCQATNPTGACRAKVVLTSSCPEDGICKIQVVANKGIVVKQDAFGKNYYTLEDNELKKVVLYSYSRNNKDSLQDGSYREEIVFECDNSIKEVVFSDNAIQKTKMLFGRFCFCKGQAGFYKVVHGTVTFQSHSGIQKGIVSFKIDQVPQIIKTISFEIK